MELSKSYIEFNGISLDDATMDELQHKESDLYLLDGELYKVLDGSIAHKREKICNYIKSIKSDFFKINELCYDDEKFYGYSMPYYDSYKPLKNLLKSKLSLDDRKKICLSLLELYKELFFDHKLTFYDWHMDNIFIGNNIKLLDIDSAIHEAGFNQERAARKFLLILILEFLNEIDDSLFVRYFHSELDILEKLVSTIDVSLCQTIPLAFEDIRKEIEEISEYKVEENKVLAKNLLKFDIYS